MDENKTAPELARERAKRLDDALNLRVPDRVPVHASFSYFPAKYVAGVTCEDAFYNQEKWLAACKKTVIDYAPDNYTLQMAVSGAVMDALGNRQLLIPGHGVPANHTHQFVETDYMKADEFDAFLADPGDYAVRVFAPRIYSKLNPLEKLPVLSSLLAGGGLGPVLNYFEDTEFIQMMDAIVSAGEEVAKWRPGIVSFNREMSDLGLPAFGSATSWAPYDLLPDMMRGMRGAMLDLYRQPDKVLEACERILPMCIEKGITGAKRMGVQRVFIPLHRGAEGFMSIKQFEKFYWPSLKELLLALIDQGLVPTPFFEGDYTSRLEYLLEIPDGKMIAHLDTTDIVRAKEVLGGHVCIQGNIPASLLQTGTPQEVKDYTKKLIDIAGKNGGYIMACRGSLDDADPILLKVWMDFTREYGVYR